MDRAVLARSLAAIDLMAVLPTEPSRRLVALPSLLASLLPIAALGPVGRRPVDQFSAIICLPCLYPLQSRQDALPPREGTATVIPEHTRSGPTHYHQVLLETPIERERVARGEEATLQRVADWARDVDVMCFYTHGSHEGPEGPSIELHDGVLREHRILPTWAGMERVELWACQSGVSVPWDPWTPPVDEAFGLDFEFLASGVRSAIGTLWSVRDDVTGFLVRRYRQALAAGRDAATALLEAQRWWVREGVPELIARCRDRPLHVAFTEFAGTLGLAVPTSDVAAVLGPAPVSESRATDADIRLLEAALTCPSAWAGYRFVGVPDRRPLRAWGADDERPPTDEERARFEEQLRELIAPTGAGAEEHEAPEVGLRERALLPADEELTVARALDMARRYEDRTASSREHNLLLGLAWLHEALATATDREDRDALAIEAAHLWLLVADGEVQGNMLVLLPPDRVLLARAERLLESVSVEAKATHSGYAAAAARLAYFRSLPTKLEGPLHDAPVRAAWKIIEPHLRREPNEDRGTIRLATVAAELLCEAPEAVPGAAQEAMAFCRAILDRVAQRIMTPAIARLLVAQNELGQQLGVMGPLPDFPYEYLTGGELARPALHRLSWFARAGVSAEMWWTRFISEALGHIETAFWGYRSGDRRELLATSGTPGRGYRSLLGYYFADKAGGKAQDAAHLIACLQLACDLRISFEHALVRLFTQVDERGVELFGPPLRRRHTLLTALGDAARVHNIDREVAEARASVVPHRLDPFTQSVEEMLGGVRRMSDETAWALADRARLSPGCETRRRTAAFQVAQAVTIINDHTREAWSRWQKLEQQLSPRNDDDTPRLSELVGPELDLKALHQRVSHAPRGQGIIGLGLNHEGSLVVSAVWGGAKGAIERLAPRDEPLMANLLLFELLRPHEGDWEPTRGRAGERQKTWEALDRIIAPALNAAISSAHAAGPIHWSVIAPGALRLLPLLGLSVNGRPLFEQAASLHHLPSLDFGGRWSFDVSHAPRLACLFAPPPETEGDCAFGEAAIRTLRRAFPPALVLDPKHFKGTTIVEVDALEPEAARLDAIRFYGIGAASTVNASTIAMHVANGRRFGVHNTSGLTLSRAPHVELWAHVTGGAYLPMVLRNDGDAIPEFAAGFLTAGARGVLDLAWPVFDLVKALVAERFHLVGRAIGFGAHSLVAALQITRSTLDRWRRESVRGETAEAALHRLDNLRREALVRDHRLSAGVVQPFTACAGASSIMGFAGADLVEETCHPVHLAAFRWWGL